MTAENLGNQLHGVQHTFADGGTALFYERGMVIKTAAGESVVSFNFPLIGRPHIATPGAALERGAISFTDGAIGTLVLEALAGRVGLMPSGSFPALPLSFGPIQTDNSEGVITYVVSASASLQERQLYDIVFRDYENSWRVVAPNAVYYRSYWRDFGIAHITDMHVARRIDSFRGRLRELGRHEAAQNMYNWNDRFRGFVRYANYLHSIGVLDVILATGDLYDYIYEEGETVGGGNAEFLRHLILGQAPGPDFSDVERLRVPIFMVPGNHDYRKHAYELIFDLVLPNELVDEISKAAIPMGLGLLSLGLQLLGGKTIERIQNYAGYNINWQDAKALTAQQHAVGDEFLRLEPDEAMRFVEIKRDPPCRAFLVKEGSYVVRLGDHRVFMLDSAHDVGVTEGIWDAVKTAIFSMGENKETFVGGSPNSEGVASGVPEAVANELAQMPANGLFILGIHAPLFNMWNNVYPYFLRETQRPIHRKQVEAFLIHHGVKSGIQSNDPDMITAAARRQFPEWFSAPPAQRQTTFVKRGTADHLLRHGVSRGGSEELLRALTGMYSARKADVVLAGHTHRHNEFRLGLDHLSGEPAFFMDFYTANPATYYPTRFFTGWRAIPKSDDIVYVPTSDVTYVEVTADAERNVTPQPMPYEATHKFQLRVPTYYNPLSNAPDARAWWAEHRPLVLQTGALGPVENTQVSFSGFRLLSVKDDVIEKIHFVSILKLEAARYSIPWEEVIAPAPGRRYKYVERSRYFNIPGAAGSPASVVLASGGTKTVCRDGQGILWELWTETNGTVGYSKLTEVAQAAPASGDPSMFLPPHTQLPVALHRGADGHVHSIYWTPGGAGSDRLSATAHAPRAAGDAIPVGHYTPATDTTHVIYRGSDRQIHTLYWVGQQVVRYDGPTTTDGALLAKGNPASYVDTDHLKYIIAYRGDDDHIHSLYWSGASPFGHDNLSYVAGAPPAAGDPVAYYIPTHAYGVNFANAAYFVNQVTYRSVYGDLIELWWVGEERVQYGNLTQLSNGPKANSDPYAYYDPASNTKHVIYYAADGHLHELWWHPGTTQPKDIDITLESLAAPAAKARPYAYVTPNPTRHHVVYRGTDNQIHEIHWP